MSLRYGTAVPNPLALAAIDNIEVTQKVSEIMALESADVGLVKFTEFYVKVDI